MYEASAPRLAHMHTCMQQACHRLDRLQSQAPENKALKTRACRSECVAKDLATAGLHSEIMHRVATHVREPFENACEKSVDCVSATSRSSEKRSHL